MSKESPDSVSSTKKVKKDMMTSENEDPEIKKCVDELIKIQEELAILNDKAIEEKLAISSKYKRLHKPHLIKRSEVISRIPKFWMKTFECHPHVSGLISEEVAECLQYVTKVEVEEAEDSSKTQQDNFKIHFYFSENPFLENEVITKEFMEVEDDDELTSTSTNIRWKKDKNLCRETEAKTTHQGRKRKWKDYNFFDWFVNNARDDIYAGFIKEDIWPDPVPFFEVAEVNEKLQNCGEEDDDDSLSILMEDDDYDYSFDEEDVDEDEGYL